MACLPSHQTFVGRAPGRLATRSQLLGHGSGIDLVNGHHHVPIPHDSDCPAYILNVGGTARIFSKSADAWVDAEIMGYLGDDLVCVRYAFGDDVCSKWLHVRSDHIFVPMQRNLSRIQDCTSQVARNDQHIHTDAQPSVHVEAGARAMQHCFHGSRDALPSECNADPVNYYVKLDYIWHLLEEGSVVLISGRWLLKHGKDLPLGPLPSRTDLPHEAIVDVDQVRLVEERLQQHRQQVTYTWELADIPKSIVAISHCWLTPDHPDPDALLLRALAPIIEAYMKNLSMYAEEFEGAFFFAWCSLFQPHHVKGRDGQYVQRRESQLTVEQTALQQHALENMDIWYTHQQTEVWMLTQSFPGQERAYNDRGWPTWERTVANLISESHAVLDLGKLDDRTLVLTMADVRQICTADRKLPTLPADFNECIQKKHFTRGCEDRDRIQRNYMRNFDFAMACATKIDYPMLHLGDDVTIMMSQEIMPLCNNLQEVSLGGNQISTVGACALSKCLPHLNLKCLSLPWNCIDADGAQALAELICQCRNLCRLDLGGNQLADEGAFGLAHCFGQCRSLELLHLNSNSIGSAGARALAQTLSQCQRLLGLSFKNNLAGDVGSCALAEALRLCCNLEWLSLGKNGISDDGALVIAEECSHVTLLDLTCNLLTKKGKQRLVEFLPRCIVKLDERRS